MAAEDLPREVHNREEDITEEHSFDELAKGLASGTVSRHRVLKLMGGALLGALLATIPGVGWAQPGTGGGKGGGGGAPQGRCPSGFTNCRGKCVILAEDRNNCGACGVICPEGRSCTNGACVEQSPCPSGQTFCNGTCVNTNGDINNCGQCGNSCEDNNPCTDKLCSVGTCLRVPLNNDTPCPEGTCQEGVCVPSVGV
jgi:Stigma-specific protein, Stig1